MKKILKGIDTLSEVIGRVDAYILLVIIAITFYEVIKRYFLHDPTLWTNELSQYLFAFYMMLGGAYVLKHKAHITMDILSSHYKPRTKALVDAITCFLGFIFLAVLIWKGGQTALTAIARNEHSTTVWAPTIIPFRLSLPIGCILFAIQYLADTIRNFYFAITGKELDPESKTEKTDDVAELAAALQKGGKEE